MTLNDIKFLKSICNDLKLHANKNATPLEEFIKVQEEKRQKAVERSTKAVYEGRKKNKLYGRSKAQLGYKKQVKILENQDNLSDLD